MEKLDDACRQVHLDGFPTGVAREEDARLPMQHIPHIQQFFGMVADHLGGHLGDAVGAEENHQSHAGHDQQGPGGYGKLPWQAQVFF